LTRTSLSVDLVRVPPGLAELDGVHALQVQDNRVRCEVDTARLDGVLRLLTEAGVRGLVSQPPTLEELFLRHYSDDLARSNGAEGELEGEASGDQASSTGAPGRDLDSTGKRP
jgi:ABC-2 type transport system ATP-binding protein